MAYVSRRSALTIIAGGGAALAAGKVRAEDKAGRVIYPVAVPVYQTQFIADRIGYFKGSGGPGFRHPGCACAGDLAGSGRSGFRRNECGCSCGRDTQCEVEGFASGAEGGDQFERLGTCVRRGMVRFFSRSRSGLSHGEGIAKCRSARGGA